MSVLIKGMEMPKNCHECPLLYATSLCDGSKDCPLILVPPHGRLIDADALNNMINWSYPMTDRIDVHNGYAICQEMIKLLPTIIEAEEGE